MEKHQWTADAETLEEIAERLAAAPIEKPVAASDGGGRAALGRTRIARRRLARADTPVGPSGLVRSGRRGRGMERL